MTTRKLLLVGELMVDVTIQTATEATKVRMGGVFHAARAAWACGTDYAIAYFCPEYLDKQVLGMAKSHAATQAIKLGNITGCPNIMLIAEPTEAGPQGYEHLLSEHLEYTCDPFRLRTLVDANTDVLIFSGNFPLQPILDCLADTSATVHVDIGNGPSQFSAFEALAKPIATLFLSTSASGFDVLSQTLPGSVQALVGTYHFPNKVWELLSLNYRHVYDRAVGPMKSSPFNHYFAFHLVADNVCGMTETYACKLHRELTNSG